jgi:hypothetical protein
VGRLGGNRALLTKFWGRKCPQAVPSQDSLLQGLVAQLGHFPCRPGWQTLRCSGRGLCSGWGSASFPHILPPLYSGPLP